MMFQLLNNRFTFKELKYDEKNICWRICLMILHFYRRHILHMTARSKLTSWPDSKINIADKFDVFSLYFTFSTIPFTETLSPLDFVLMTAISSGNGFRNLFLSQLESGGHLVCPTPRQVKVLFSKEWPMSFRKLDKSFIS